MNRGLRVALLAGVLALLVPASAPAVDDGAEAESGPTYTPAYTPAPEPPSNRFRFAGLIKRRSNGFAVLFVRVPGPGTVKLDGRGFRRLSRPARQAATIRLPIKPKVRLRHFLKRHGKGRIRAIVTFTPTGGEPRTREKVIVLKRKRR